ncbi:NmrA family NAD(P)-binding protein [Qipengyuania sp. 6D47A]|uniref:NmrA family NAD(P)-binding protein n=1 Tax=Qipengyuania qiaonensis TaxID=2867240 RepID=A0ABS7J3U0_9SPHN|nr:NmrA family NAD(P)-binding protein [Qipengyuania qiaonensis]
MGSAVAEALLRDGHEVIAITRDAANAAALKEKGASIAVADLYDVDAMRDVFRKGKRLFLLNPPAKPDTDTDRAENETARLLLAAVEGSGLEKIVAESTYGAQPGEQLGDLNTLHTMEEGLRDQRVPTTILRAAYYFSNWDAMLETVREGTLPTMYPADLKLPMVAPADLGDAAADLLTAPVEETGIVHVEGPTRYSSRDVADAFAHTLGRKVEVAVTPRDHWEETYRSLGFSEEAAHSYARMTAITADGDYEMPNEPVRGSTTLQDYIDALVERD